LFVAAALLQASGTKIVEKDHSTKAVNPALVDEINVILFCLSFHLRPL
jgi:hypothetical protein